MACYLKNRFPSHSVDVEYDRVRAGGDRKRLGPRCVELDLFIPDLIVHKRGDNERNLLAVECKLDRGDGINRDQKTSDIRKLKDLIKNKKYRYAAFVVIEVGANRRPNGGYEICWGRGFRGGVEGFEAGTCSRQGA